MSGTHVITLTMEGLVFTWGEGRKGQLGHGDLGKKIDDKSEKCHWETATASMSYFIYTMEFLIKLPHC